MTVTRKKILRALAEIGFIMLLFYTNLLMGEFIRSHSTKNAPTLLWAIEDIFTPANAIIGLVGALVGYFCIELFRNKL